MARLRERQWLRRRSPINVFRVGVDGTNAPLASATANLPQPWSPGVNDVSTGSDEFNLSIQHQFSPKVTAEVGYIGRIIRNELAFQNRLSSD